MDETIVEFLNFFVGRNGFADLVIIIAAKWLAYFLAVIVLGYWLVKKNQATRLILASLVSALLARFVFTEIIRHLYNRPRPFELLTDLNQLISHSPGGSFPSGHAAFFFGLAAAAYIYNRSLGTFLFVGGILIGLARITTGLHWPSDVLAGLFLGLVSAALVNAFFQKPKIASED